MNIIEWMLAKTAMMFVVCRPTVAMLTAQAAGCIVILFLKREFILYKAFDHPMKQYIKYACERGSVCACDGAYICVHVCIIDNNVITYMTLNNECID